MDVISYLTLDPMVHLYQTKVNVRMNVRLQISQCGQTL